MAIKKITLTEDHLKLISAIKFEAFNFGDICNTNAIDDAIAAMVELENKDGIDENLKGKIAMAMTDLGNARVKIKAFGDNAGVYGWGINQHNLFGGGYVLEDVALILGKFDQRIMDESNEEQGYRFPQELEDYMYGLYEYIYKNLTYIISLVLQYSSEGGLKPGTYKCLDYEKIWTKID